MPPMPPMPRCRARATALSVFVCLSLVLTAGPSWAGSGPEPEPAQAEAPSEGPARPDAAPDPSAGSEESPTPEVPAPTLSPNRAPEGEEPGPGIEFAVPPPEAEAEAEDETARAERPLTVSFPDPGVAPNDGASMLVLSGTTIGLTAFGFATGLIVGLNRDVDLGWLLPSTIVPTVGLLAFAGGGLYLGIKRARAHRRWEIGHRVIGLPQGGGLLAGGTFTLVAALGLIPAGAFAVDEQPALGYALIGVGAAAAIATPVMIVIGARNARRYQRTGGWKRKPLPPLPPGASGARLELQPTISPLWGGAAIGAVGRF